MWEEALFFARRQERPTEVCGDALSAVLTTRNSKMSARGAALRTKTMLSPAGARRLVRDRGNGGLSAEESPLSEGSEDSRSLLQGNLHLLVSR